MAARTVIDSVLDASRIGVAILASDDALTAVYLNMPFGEVAVDREGIVRLAADYDAMRGAR